MMAFALLAACLLVLAGWHLLSERPSALRHQVLELATAAVQRGRPIADLLQRAAEGQPKKVRRVLHDIAEELDAGLALSEALATAPDHFPQSLREAIAAAEGGPELGATLEGLAATAAAALTAGHRRHLALAYPAVLALALLACVEATGPAIAAMGRARGAFVPADWSAWVSYFAPSQWGLGGRGGAVALCLIVLGYFWMATVPARTRRGQRCLAMVRDAVAPWTTALSAGQRRRQRAAFLSTLAAQVRTGQPLDRALDLGAAVLVGAARRRAATAAAAVREGRCPRSVDTWRAAGFGLPVAIRAAAASGRDPERLAAVLTDAAALEERNLHAANERMLQWIPIAAVLTFGCLVAGQFAQLFTEIGQVQEHVLLEAGVSGW